nr:unnamed protein product [Naegleria fowleri]
MLDIHHHSPQQYEATHQRFLAMSNEFGWASVNWTDFFSHPEHVLPKGLLSCSEALPITQEAQTWSVHMDHDDDHHSCCNNNGTTSAAASYNHTSSHSSSRRKSLGIKRRPSCNPTQVICISDDDDVEEITKDSAFTNSTNSTNITNKVYISNPVCPSQNSQKSYCDDDGEAEYEFKEESEIEEDLSDNIYEIEKILKKRIRNSKPEYYVKWVGYPSSENSWVKKCDIFDEECIKEFEKSFESQSHHTKQQPIDLCDDVDSDNSIEYDDEESDEEDKANDFLLSDDDDDDDDDNIFSTAGKKTTSRETPKLHAALDFDSTTKRSKSQKTLNQSKYIADPKQFKKVRGKLLQKYYDEINSVCFKNKLPALKLSEGKAKDLKGKPYLLWNHHLRKTAGYCKLFTLKKSRNGKSTQLEKVVAIEISTKVCNCEERLVHTLAHEMCHAASFLFDGVTGHGKTFYSYGDLIKKYYPDIPITTCHSYAIDYKYQWQCVDCGSIINRHSKSIDVTKQCCGVCKGRLQEIGKSSNTKNNAYNSYVKEHYKRFKEHHPHLKQGEIMKLVAQSYREQRHGTTTTHD